MFVLAIWLVCPIDYIHDIFNIPGLANYTSSLVLRVISSNVVKAMAKLQSWLAISLSLHKSVSSTEVLSTTTGAGWYLLEMESSFLRLHVKIDTRRAPSIRASNSSGERNDPRFHTMNR